MLTDVTSRAIHLELTPGMLTPSFLRKFKTFFTRHGTMDRVIIDNSKKFRTKEVKHYFVKFHFVCLNSVGRVLRTACQKCETNLEKDT